MRMLVTAGPTREYIDPVRYLSNDSSGRMGFAIARAAARRGHEVVLVSGPTALRPPAAAEFVSVMSARDMNEAVRRHFPDCDCLVMSAAVSDFRPKRAATRKIKKEDMGESIALTRNPDIVAGVTRNKGDRVVIGFALETDNAVANAMDKMRRKRFDYVVLNSPDVIGSKEGSVTILGRDGEERATASGAKDSLARTIVRVAEAAHDERSKR